MRKQSDLFRYLTALNEAMIQAEKTLPLSTIFSFRQKVYPLKEKWVQPR